MKNGLALFGLLAILGTGASLYFFAFHGSSDAPLVADGILVFDSAKAAADRYGYIDKTYTAALPSWPEEAHNGIPAPADGLDHYLRIQFSAQRPSAVVHAEALAELNRVRAQKGKRTWNSAAMQKVQLYSISADFQITCAKSGHSGPDVALYQRQDDDIASLLKRLFDNNGAGKLAVDPGDPHVLTFTAWRETGGTANFTLKFALDWKTAEISMVDAAGGSVTVTASTQEPDVPEGPFLAKLTTTGLANTTTGAEYMFAGVSSRGLINPVIPLYFHKDDRYAGKAYLLGKTYKFRAAMRDGALKLFLDNDAVLSIDPQKPTTSLIYYDQPVLVTYTTTLEKVDAKGKEQQLAANFSSLGSVPETVTGAPNVWGTYFDLSQRQYTAKDIVSNPVLRQVFGGRPQGSSAGGAVALEVAASATRQAGIAAHGVARVAHATAAPDPNRPKTDTEIEQEMQDKLRKRRY